MSINLFCCLQPKLEMFLSAYSTESQEVKNMGPTLCILMYMTRKQFTVPQLNLQPVQPKHELKNCLICPLYIFLSFLISGYCPLFSVAPSIGLSKLQQFKSLRRGPNYKVNSGLDALGIWTSNCFICQSKTDLAFYKALI